MIVGLTLWTRRRLPTARQLPQPHTGRKECRIPDERRAVAGDGVHRSSLLEEDIPQCSGDDHGRHLLGALVVLGEAQRVERRPLGADVAVGAAHAEGKGEPPHRGDERTLVDGLGKHLEVRKGVWWEASLGGGGTTGNWSGGGN